jgi:hypothetical protein
MRSRLLACLFLAASCRVPAVDFTGKACPCPGGYACDTATNTCTQAAVVDGRVADASHDARTDAPGDAGSDRYRAAVIADSPVAYWRLDDTGSAAVDAMGHADGTYQGSCTHGVAGALAGDPDTAVALDGSSCEVVLPDPGSLLEFTGTQPYSLEAWIDDAAVTTGFRVVFSKESRMTGPVDGYAMVDSPTGAYFERAVSHSAPTTMPATHPNGQYVHLVGVFDGSAFVLYTDAVAGIAYADGSAMPAYTADGLIGADLDGDHFAGSIDEVAVYGHALTAQQVATHYQIATTP